MTTGLDSRTGSLGTRGVGGSPSSFFPLATSQASSLRGDGQSRLSFQSVLRHGRSPAGVLSWIVGVLSPRNISADFRGPNAAELSSFPYPSWGCVPKGRTRATNCPLSGVKQTLIECAAMSVNDSKQTSGLRTMRSQIKARLSGCSLSADRRHRSIEVQSKYVIVDIQIIGRKPHPSTGLDGRIGFKNKAIREASDLTHRSSLPSI